MPVRPAASPPPRPPTTAPSAPALAARTWAEGLDLDRARNGRMAVARTKAPTTGPAGVQRAFALYRTWEDRDLGSVRLLKAAVDGRDVFLIHATTDGDDSFVELFGHQGALLASGTRGADGAITWDTIPGAVRDRVAARDATPTVQAFFGSVAAAEHAGSLAGDKLAADELRRAAAHLIGTDLALSSVDEQEAAALCRVLADQHALTPSARAWALRLGALYADDAPKALRKPRERPLHTVTGGDTPFSSRATLLSAEVKGKRDAPRLLTFAALLRTSHDRIPTQLAPASRTAATRALRDAGATAAEAKKTLDELVANGAQLFMGRVMSWDSATATAPKDVGLLVGACTADGKRVRAVVIAQEPVAPGGGTPRAAIAALTGVDREIANVTATGGAAYSLEWTPPFGGTMRATLDLANPAQPKVTGTQLSPILETSLRALLAGHVKAALGRDVDVIGWVGRDNASGPGFVVAHKAPGTPWPVQLSEVRIALGGAATVTPKVIGASASDRELARDLALAVSRAHAERMVQEPGLDPAAPLEVALRTRWRTAAELVEVDPADSPVGFDPATDRFQWMLPKVWGDHAVVVTFLRDGRVRVDDAN